MLVATFECFSALLTSPDLRLGRVVIDEVHFLADESRGPTLETLLVRLKPRKRPTSICALSAVISNPQEKSNEGGIVSMGERAPRLYANTFSIEASLFDFCFKFGLHD